MPRIKWSSRSFLIDLIKPIPTLVPTPEIANLIEAGLNEYHYDHAHKNLKEAIIDNVKYNRAIVEKHVSSEKIESGQLAVVGAYFDFETKKVMFLDS